MIDGKEQIWAGIRGNRFELSERLGDLPDSPGIYAYRGSHGEILYVGKARNLRSRVRSYFGSNLPPKTEALMARVEGIETILVDSEAEALILEANLIKKHKPRYNILLRDDKSYPYLRVGIKDEWPSVTVVRRMGKDGARYFGPFTRPGSVRETLSFLRRVFPYRTCSDRALAQAARPCLDYQIGRCLGPCTGKISREVYMETIDEVVKFLEGRHRDVRNKLVKRMDYYATELDFENAARVRDRVMALDDTTERQKVSLQDMKDRDILGVSRSGRYAFVALLQIRQGKLVGKEGLILSGTEYDEDEETFRAFITQYYPNASSIPKELIIPVTMKDKEEIEQYLGAKIRTPIRGTFKDLALMAADNARAMVQTHIPRLQREAQEHLKAMHDVSEALGLPRLPRRIECYDISNTSGKEAVASMVVFQDGKPDKKSYRRFRMQLSDGPNDYAMMQEALWRRFKRGLQERASAETEDRVTGKQRKFSAFPDLVIVDGGKGQVSAAKQVFDELNLDIPLAGLAERNEELFIPKQSEPIILPRDSGALFLVVRARDEAHRFALSYHRSLRSKKSTETVLSEIQGLGPNKIKELLRTFGSADAVKTASFEELQKAKGIGPEMARMIREFFSGSKPQL